MKISATLRLFASGVVFTTVVHATSITADGIPAGFKAPARPNRNKTDFGSIFSEILSKHKATPKTTRDIVGRDVTPPAPNFFDLTFGPTNAANNAIGYMGFVSLPTYDVDACAALCNTRGFDASSGPCIFFNLWSAVVNGTVTDNVCSLYNTVTDSSTATNIGQLNITVAASRGYSRKSFIQDGSFQDYTCVLIPGGSCPFVPSAFWTRDILGPNNGFILVNNNPAHSGTSSALFFFTTDTPPPFLGDTLTYALPINTTAGKEYVISYFRTPTSVQPPLPNFEGPMISVLWNGEAVDNATQAGPVEVSTVLTYFNSLTPVTAKGNDSLVFVNEPTFTHTLYVDDIAIFEKWF